MILSIIFGTIMVVTLVFTWLLCTGASKAVLNQKDKSDERWIPVSEITNIRLGNQTDEENNGEQEDDELTEESEDLVGDMM